LLGQNDALELVTIRYSEIYLGEWTYVQKGWIITSMQNAPIPSLLLAFAHIHGEARTPTEGIESAVVGRNGLFLCMYVQKGWIKYIFPCKTNAPILATFDTNPSPHRRFNEPSLLLAFAHIHGEAGTPTESIGSAVVGRNGL
jgi:hypothetical protein